jgi:cell division protein FtsB
VTLAQLAGDTIQATRFRQQGSCNRFATTGLQQQGVEFAMKALMIGLVLVLVLVLVILQWRLWAGDGGMGELRQLERQVAEQQKENETLRLRNQMLENEVLDLKNGLEAVEERARADLGMIRDDETFYMIIE